MYLGKLVEVGTSRADLSRSETSLHAGSSQRRADSGSGGEEATHRPEGRCAHADQSAFGLPFPHAVSDCRRSLQDRRAAAAAAGTTAAMRPAIWSRMKFEVLIRIRQTRARRGRLQLAHGVIETPVFMPVGTQATVKSMTPDQLRDLQVEILLCNSYHLFLRPGHETVARLGGLHRFMGWDRPILTDSGGYQVFSLQHARGTSATMAFDFSHIWTVARIFSAPETAVDIQQRPWLGHHDGSGRLPGVPGDAFRSGQVHETVDGMGRRAARRIRTERRPSAPGAFRNCSRRDLCRPSKGKRRTHCIAMDFPGYAIGGLAVGEPKPLMYEVIEQLEPHLPAGQTAISDGRGNARRSGRVRRARCGHVRLRDADATCAERLAIHSGRSHRDQACEIQGRSGPDRRVVRVPGVPDVFAGIFEASFHRE